MTGDQAGPGFRVVGSERPFTGRLVSVRVDRVVHDDGRESTREVVEHPGAVAALAVDEAGLILLVEQWRHPAGRRLLEVAAGAYDVQGEPVTETLRRELAEELRVEGGTLTWLTSFHTTPGWSDEVVDLYLAEGVRPVQGTSAPGDWEEAGIRVVALPFEEAVRRVAGNPPGDAKTLVALGLYGLVRAGTWAPGLAGAPAPDAPARRAAARPGMG